MRRRIATWTSLHAALLSAGSWYAGVAEAAAGNWLEWIRAGGAQHCPDAAAFAAKIEKQLGRSPAVAAEDSQRRLVAHIAREVNAPARWSAAVDVFDSSGNLVGRRTIAKVSASCEPAADALALVSALILSDLSIANPASAPVPVPLRPETSSDAASETAASAPVLPPTKTRGWAAAVEGGLSAAAGLLPGLDLGGAVRVLVAPRSWPALYATVAFWQQATQSIPGGRGANLETAASQESIVSHREAWVSLRAALDAIDPAQREVFVLYEIEELGMADVARAVGCPLQTAYSRLHAARKIVAAALGEHLEVE